MSAAESPAALLRRAAEKMRTLAEAAPRGPWHVEVLNAKGYPQRISNAGAVVIGQTFTNPTYPPASANFIAAMHPDVALLIAATWLSIASDLDGGYLAPTTHLNALRAAQAFLGEAVPTDG